MHRQIQKEHLLMIININIIPSINAQHNMKMIISVQS